VNKHRYTQEQIQFIREIAEGKTLEEIQELVKRNYNLVVSVRSVQGVMYRNGIKNGMKGYTTRFNKGQSPWNKDMKGIQTGGEEGWFKKGNLPPSHKPVGSESIQEGCIWVKVAEPNKWVKKHHLIWIESNGPIPEGYVIRFADGSKMNVVLDNLFLTSRRVLTSVVKRGMDYDDPELKRTVHNLAELELAIKDIKKRENA
jgi:hypothetical protein